jgi:hypothetical protein
MINQLGRLSISCRYDFRNTVFRGEIRDRLLPRVGIQWPSDGLCCRTAPTLRFHCVRRVQWSSRTMTPTGRTSSSKVQALLGRFSACVRPSRLPEPNVSKPEAAEQGSIVSPYLSLRQVVRPAIAAYSLLAREQERSAALARDADTLLKSTRELLKAIGLVHLLSPASGQEMSPNDDQDRQSRLLVAFADAGLAWANAVGACVALADGLIEEERWNDVRRLTRLLKDAGETGVVEDLEKQIKQAVKEQPRKRLDRIHNRMSPKELDESIDALRSLPEEYPNRTLEIGSHLLPLARSITAIFPDLLKQTGLGSPSAIINDPGWHARVSPEEWFTMLVNSYFGRRANASS